MPIKSIAPEEANRKVCPLCMVNISNPNDSSPLYCQAYYCMAWSTDPDDESKGRCGMVQIQADECKTTTKVEVTPTNNFCRVFELPLKFSSEFCFDGPIKTEFNMVDWFYPVDNSLPAVIDLQKLKSTLLRWIPKKPYFRTGHTYLVLCGFGEAFVIKGSAAS